MIDQNATVPTSLLRVVPMNYSHRVPTCDHSRSSGLVWVWVCFDTNGSDVRGVKRQAKNDSRVGGARDALMRYV
jgi:hypothetical protein